MTDTTLAAQTDVCLLHLASDGEQQDTGIVCALLVPFPIMDKGGKLSSTVTLLAGAFQIQQNVSQLKSSFKVIPIQDKLCKACLQILNERIQIT